MNKYTIQSIQRVSRLLLFTLLASLSSQTLAQNHVDTNKTILRVGVQFNSVYFGVVEGFSANCLFQNIYVDGATDQGRLSYSMLLAAHAAGRKLSRIDYYQSAPGEACTLALVEISE